MMGIWFNGSRTPGARETWTCCLEPGEVVAVNLSATGPVDAVLMDLDSYEVPGGTRRYAILSALCQ